MLLFFLLSLFYIHFGRFYSVVLSINSVNLLNKRVAIEAFDKSDEEKLFLIHLLWHHMIYEHERVNIHKCERISSRFRLLPRNGGSNAMFSMEMILKFEALFVA